MRSLVTPHLSLTGETNPPNLGRIDEEDLQPNLPPLALVEPSSDAVWTVSPITKVQTVGFCDWISIYQRHGGNLPRINDGAIVRVNAEGETECVTLKRWQLEGSYKTGVMIRCDGETVWFDGNVSRYGRPDNVFGYTFQQCLLIVNDILAKLGLPAFTPGESFLSNHKGTIKRIWTGARITRIDITQNYATGSKEDAFHYMRYLASQQASRLKTGTWGEGETVDFGRGSRVIMWKAYLKAEELRKHNKKLAVEGDYTKEKSAYVEVLANWCDSVGLVRVEVTFKSTKLHNMGCNFLGAFDMRLIEGEFYHQTDLLTRASADIDEITELPKQLLSTYRMWQAGDDVTSKISRATFYRHRRELLPYGVDIAVKSNVIALKTKTRIIKLGPVAVPDFYELPEIERKRYVAHG